MMLLTEKAPAQTEASMRCVMQFLVLLAACVGATGSAAERVQLAQVITPGQVQPVPLTPTPLISSQTSTACLVGCDTQVMTCQNACLPTSPATGIPVNPAASAGTSPCALSCTTQQLVCKQACTRPQQ